MQRKIYFLLIAGLFCFSLAGCEKGAENEVSQSTEGKTIRREGEPDVAQVPTEDKAMNNAIATARKTVKTFIAALNSPAKGQEKFSIKKPFKHGESAEHIWLDNITYDGSVFHGIVANDPVEVQNVKLGDEVTVAPTEISDWMFADKGKLVGGYTIRVLYTNLSPKEKENFKQQFELKLE